MNALVENLCSGATIFREKIPLFAIDAYSKAAQLNTTGIEERVGTGHPY
jgi:hypothetical protein